MHVMVHVCLNYTVYVAREKSMIVASWCTPCTLAFNAFDLLDYVASPVLVAISTAQCCVPGLPTWLTCWTMSKHIFLHQCIASYTISCIKHTRLTRLILPTIMYILVSLASQHQFINQHVRNGRERKLDRAENSRTVYITCMISLLRRALQLHSPLVQEVHINEWEDIYGCNWSTISLIN